MNNKTNPFRYAFLMLLIFGASSISFASDSLTECIWTGAEDNYWTNKNNWVNGVKPSGSNTKAVFDPGDGKIFYIDMKNQGWGVGTSWPNKYEFKSGATYFSSYIRYSGDKTKPGVFYVEQGVTAVVTNQIFTATGSTCMEKTGNGQLTCIGLIGHDGIIPNVIVAEGTLRYIDLNGDKGNLSKVPRVTVKSGATFYTSGGSATLGNGNLVVNIEKGGLFKASCGGYSSANTIDHLEGEGTVEGLGDSGLGLKIKGTTAGEAFSGNFTGNVKLEFTKSDNPVVIGGTDTLAGVKECILSPNVRFMPSNKPYKINHLSIADSGEYAALDTEDNPVAVNVTSRITVGSGDKEFSFANLYTSGTYGFYWGKDDSGFTIRSGRYCATPVPSKNGDATRNLPFPDGMIMRIPNKNSFIKMYGGELWLYTRSLECQMPSTFDLYGGDLVLVGSCPNNVFKGATSANPAVLNLRGGKVLASMRDDIYFGSTVFPETNAFRVLVHDKPATIKVINHYADGGPDRYMTLNRPIESGIADGKDGGLILEGAPVFQFKYPVLLNGPFTAMDGEIQIMNEADTQQTPAFLGTGDINLGNVKFRFANKPTTSKTLKFATDEGAVFRVKGATQFTFKTEDTDPSHHIEIGGEFERIGGGVLFLSEKGCANGFSSSFKVDGGAELNASGLTKVPVLFYDTAERHRFATCNNQGYIVPFENAASTLDNAADKAVFLNSDAALAAGEEKSVAALIINDVKLTLSEGSKLNVGIGDDPALFVYNKTYLSGVTPKGTGTIDFGNREGVFVIDVRSEDIGKLNIPYSLAGTGGITFISSPEKNHKDLKLSGANTYSGITKINSIRVEPATPAAFGLSEVHIGGGERAGGRVYFGTPVKLENDFHVSGRGMAEDIWDTTDGGAFVFASNSEIAGSVTLEGDTRVVANKKSRAEISGSIKGNGNFMLYSGNGTLVLSGMNTYDGGTEIVKSTLAITHAGTLGSGNVVLNYGTLAIENDSAITFTNNLSGVGTVAFKGAAPVSFACDMSQLNAGLDLCGNKYTFAELPPFSSITNSSPAKATIALEGGLGNVEWEGKTLGGKISLDIGEGTTLDLKGGTLDVYRLERGAIGKVVNGTVNEAHPIIGLWIVIR